MEEKTLSRSLLISSSLRKRWWIVVLLTLGAVGVSALLTARQTPVFQASASLVVAPNTVIESATDLIRSLETLERRTIVATFAKIPLAPETRQRATRKLELEASDLRGYRISASVQPYTNIILIEVHGPDRDRVATLANAVAEATQETARSMYRIYSLKNLAGAQPAYQPVYPDPERNYLVAAILGFALGLLIVLLPGIRASLPGPSA